MRKISFLKLIPGGNPTILVPGYEVPVEQRAAVARELMHPLHLQAEQVGYIELGPDLPRLDMMGGEFCLNATRCLVFEATRQNRFLPLAGTDDLFGLVKSSGIPEPLQVRVKNGKTVLLKNSPGDIGALNGLNCLSNLESLDCLVSVSSQLNAEDRREIGPGAVLLRLPGISHLLLDEKLHPLPVDAPAAAATWREKLGLDAEPASGVVWHRELKAPGRFAAEPGKIVLFRRITPVVHVAETGSSILESACGSGTLALGLLSLDLLESYLHSKVPAGKTLQAISNTQTLFMNVQQPSGEFLRLKIEFSPPQCKQNLPGTGGKNGQGGKLYYTAEVGGTVRLCSSGEAFVSLSGTE